MTKLTAYLTPAATAAIKAANAAHHLRLAEMRRERVCRELISKLRRPGQRNVAASRRMSEFPLIGVAR